MIDPHNFTNFKRSEAQLEEMLLFSIAVAGKTAVVTSRKISEFLDIAKKRVNQVWGPMDALMRSPFRILMLLRAVSRKTRTDEILGAMQKAKTGKYRVMRRAIEELLKKNYDLRHCSLEDLLKIPGIGPKTARMFILHSRKGVEYAVPDTHILAELRERGYEVPKTSPTSEIWLRKLDRYVKVEAGIDGMSMVEWDLFIWKKRTKSKPLGQETVNAVKRRTRISSVSPSRSRDNTGVSRLRKDQNNNRANWSPHQRGRQPS